MPDATHETLPADEAIQPDPSARSLRVVTSGELLQGAREILIRHGADHYRLRLTRVGKLILNK